MSKLTDSTLSIIAALAALLFIAKTGMSADMPATGELPISSRQEFAKRAMQITQNMPEAKVEALLGTPDYVGHFDKREFPNSPTVWFYGCIGLYRFASLGSVSFSAQGLVTQCNRYAPPPQDSVISEPELRTALLLLDRVASNDATNPGAFIRVVNGLLPLGKAKILAAIEEYHNVITARERPDQSIEWNQPLPTDPSSRDALFIASQAPASKDEALLFLVRTIFDLPPSRKSPNGVTKPFAYPMIGAIVPPAPYDATICPRYPVVLNGDIPILEFIGASLAGYPEQVTDELPFLSKNARLRTGPLHPTDHPEDYLAKLEASPQWFFGRRYRVANGYRFGSGGPMFYEHSDSLEDQVRTAVKEQILKLLSPLYPDVLSIKPPFNRFEKGFQIEVDLSRWDAIMSDLKVHPVRWNPNTEEYERRDKAPQEPPVLPASKL